MIQVDSAVNAGTTFRVLLPNASDLAPDEEIDATPVGAATSGRVLIVEDEGAVRRFLRSTLERNGFDVTEAEDGATALQLASARPDGFDVVVTDINMPEMSGTELARRIAVQLPRVPVLFLSGYPQPSLGAAGDPMPLENFLQKPFGEEEIVGALQRLIARARPS